MREPRFKPQKYYGVTCQSHNVLGSALNNVSIKHINRSAQTILQIQEHFFEFDLQLVQS